MVVIPLFCAKNEVLISFNVAGRNYILLEERKKVKLSSIRTSTGAQDIMIVCLTRQFPKSNATVNVEVTYLIATTWTL